MSFQARYEALKPLTGLFVFMRPLRTWKFTDWETWYSIKMEIERIAWLGDLSFSTTDEEMEEELYFREAA